jgi:chromate transporter
MKRSALAVTPGIFPIGWVFLKIGLLFFGGGFVLIPVIHREIVMNLHWLTEREFLDGVAISQLTPGPIAVLATFCGFRQGGVIGALVATASVFLPAFLLMLLISHGYQHLSKMASVRAVLNTLLPAIVGLLLAAAFQLGGKALVGTYGFVVFVISLFVLIHWKVSPAILILAGAVLGWGLRL